MESQNSPPAPDSDQARELCFLEGVAGRIPARSWILKPLGDLYTRCGKFKKGLQVDLRLTRLCPGEPEVWYNLGCSFALLDHKVDACSALEKAVELGYTDAGWMRNDDDLRSVRDLPEFQKLLRKLEGKEG